MARNFNAELDYKLDAYKEKIEKLNRRIKELEKYNREADKRLQHFEEYLNQKGISIETVLGENE